MTASQFADGLAYDDGQGGVTFFEEAEKSFRKALKQEVRDAQYNLGKMYENERSSLLPFME